jgi:hypothetical protein
VVIPTETVIFLLNVVEAEWVVVVTNLRPEEEVLAEQTEEIPLVTAVLGIPETGILIEAVMAETVTPQIIIATQEQGHIKGLIILILTTGTMVI